MPKFLLHSLLLLFACLPMRAVLAQGKEIPNTTEFTIEGRVKNPVTISLSELQKMKAVTVKKLVIYNHLMEKKKELQQVTGIPLTTLLETAIIDAASPKNLSEYYITCVAADGYQVVFSWNELFNMKSGTQVIVITGQDGQTAEKTANYITLISPADLATGRRYVKGLSRIIVSQVK